jgi:exodeoxyribonuclease V alpha subunit
MPAEKTIEGTVKRVVFVNEENGYTVARLDVDGELEQVTIVGNLAALTEGELLRCHGEWVTDRRFGRQFAVERVEPLMPSTTQGIERYLSSGLIPGVGEVFARRIVERFGEDTLDVIGRTPERLLEIEGIGAKKLKGIKEAWAEQHGIREMLVFLQSYGITTTFAIRIWKHYGADSLAQVKRNPYQLALDITGIGFFTADKIARHLGFAEDSIERAEAGVVYALEQAAGADGHCYLPPHALVGKAKELLGVGEGLILEAMRRLVETRLLVYDRFDETAPELAGASDDELLALAMKPPRGEMPVAGVYLKSLYRAEQGITTKLATISLAKGLLPAIRLPQAVKWVQQQVGIELSPEQQNALRAALHEKVLVITGGPGTGKTTLVDCLVRILRAKNVTFALCAPTGRAAKRLAEVTGCEAATIHRLLEYSPKAGVFMRREGNEIEANVVIVDEVSMIDAPLMDNLLRAVSPPTHLVLIGDADQLPSVGPGSVLRDLIASNVVPAARLTHIFRQAERSLIITNAHRINHGEFPRVERSTTKLSDFYFIEKQTQQEILDVIKELLVERIPKRFELDPVNDVQVLSPIHKGLVGVENLNVELQQLLNPGGEKLVFGGRNLRIGDKVMQVRNDYVKEVYNGDLGRITGFDDEHRCLLVEIDGRAIRYERGEADEIVLAYAASIHKAQGCEYPAVVVPMVTQHYMLLQRNLLYTAVTRGKQLVVLVGQPKAINIAIHNDKTLVRYTRLAERVRESVGTSGR